MKLGSSGGVVSLPDSHRSVMDLHPGLFSANEMATINDSSLEILETCADPPKHGFEGHSMRTAFGEGFRHTNPPRTNSTWHGLQHASQRTAGYVSSPITSHDWLLVLMCVEDSYMFPICPWLFCAFIRHVSLCSVQSITSCVPYLCLLSSLFSIFVSLVFDFVSGFFMYTVCYTILCYTYTVDCLTFVCF